MKISTACLCFCFLVFVFSGENLFGQDILAKGVIINKISKNRIALAEITNQRTGDAVGSNDLGFFQIMAIPGDTLLIRKRNFGAAKVAVTGAKDMVIYLIATVNTIEEVKITSWSKKKELAEMQQDYKKKGSFYGGKPPLLSFIFTPITALYELFGKTPKNARRFGKYYQSELQQIKIDGFFNETIISNNTGLTGASLNQFMLDYRPDFEVAKNWNTYDAIRYIKESYKKYADTARK